ncbi:MAG: hypothetical protein M3R43_09760 [Acidobacteriota bacterium]|nr:hypothetical protein [Acidobacteriota bacterium]
MVENTSINYVTPLGYTLAATQTGQVLVWRLLPTNADVAYFTVDFPSVDADPCYPHDPIVGWKGHDGQCKVTKKSEAESPVMYSYSTEMHMQDREHKDNKGGKGDIPFRFIPCYNCGGILGPANPPQPNPNQPAAVGSTAPPAGTRTPHARAAAVTPGVVQISCSDGSLNLDQSPVNGGYITWIADGTVDPSWTVKFATSPCGTDSTFSASQNTCTVPAHQQPGTYSYTVHVDNSDVCKDVPGKVKVP